MNKVKLLLLFFAVLTSFYSCSEKNDGAAGITSLTLSVDKTRIVADTSDYAIARVTDQNGTDVTSKVTIWFNDKKISAPKIISVTPCISTAYAEYGSVRSNEVGIEAVEDKNLKFQKNVLIEQYTGTWCGWCPRAINFIGVLQNTDKNIVHVAYHLTDEMTFSMNMPLFQSFGFTGIPTVHADRSLVWSGSSGDIAPMHAPSRIGISMDVSGNSTKINAEIKVKFGIRFTDGLEISVYLLHDSLIANQSNYYNTDPNSPYYKKGAIMLDFVHHNVMIQAGTNMFGEKIPVTNVDIGTVYTKNAVFTDFRCEDIKRIKIVAFVTYESGKKVDKVANCMIAGVGEKKEFVYAGK